MSSPVRALLNILIIAILIGGVYLLSQNVDPLRLKAAELLHVSPKVLGVTTRINPADEIKKEVENQAEEVKKQALNIRVSDVLTTVNRLQKIGHDLHDVQAFTFTQIDMLLKKKEFSLDTRK